MFVRVNETLLENFRYCRVRNFKKSNFVGKNLICTAPAARLTETFRESEQVAEVRVVASVRG